MKDQYISTIKCFDIKCNMTPLFFNEYISTDNYRHKVILSSVNPTKLSVVQFLVDYHTKRKQQMIIFCEGKNIFRSDISQTECADLMSLAGVIINGYDLETCKQRTLVAYYLYYRK